LEQPELDKLHRDSEGIIAKYGNTTIWALRKAYGESFAPNQDENAKLSDVFDQMDEASLASLIKEEPTKER
jgi:hypothetical protein